MKKKKAQIIGPGEYSNQTTEWQPLYTHYDGYDTDGYDTSVDEELPISFLGM